MGKYPHLEYSMHEVRKAGERLNGPMQWTDDTRDDIISAFHIAESWRSSHIYPMRSVRSSLTQRMRSAKVGGFTAARAKRLSSVRSKLKRLPTIKLDQFNDLAGCRAVVNDIQGVWKLVENCRQKMTHEVRQEYDYITKVRADGYRSYHIVFTFKGDGAAYAFNGHRVEVQVRTRLQHSWATAVEAVGLFRNEDMKSGGGDPDWLRLFFLMSVEFAVAERCHEEGDVERLVRMAEIKELNDKLGAVRFLDTLKTATRFIDTYVLPTDQSPYYTIKYDQRDHTVRVELYQDALSGARAFGQLEFGMATGGHAFDAVFVDVGQMRNLKAAYPGYFGDVALFVQNLRSVCEGGGSLEYTLIPQVVLQPRPWEQPDPSWFHQPRRRQWVEPTHRPRHKRKKKR